MMPITIALNIGNFASYCALEPTLQVIDEFELIVAWRVLRPDDTPFTAPPSADDPLADYKLARKRARDNWASAEFERDCERLGLDPLLTPRHIDASGANAGLQFLADRGDDVRDYLKAVFKRGFVDRRSLATIADIRDLVGGSGFEAYVEAVDARFDEIEQELTESLIYTGPAYIVEGEAFIGRQHFPLIRWILGGRKGAPPV